MPDTFAVLRRAPGLSPPARIPAFHVRRLANRAHIRFALFLPLQAIAYEGKAATVSISTRAPRGSLLTSTQERAGHGSGKYCL